MTIQKEDLCQVARIFDGIKTANFSGVRVINILSVLRVNSIRVTTTTLDAYMTHSGHNKTRYRLFQVRDHVQSCICTACAAYIISQLYSELYIVSCY